MIRRLAFAAILSLPVAPALAQNAPAFEWTGMYVGLQGGWELHHDDNAQLNSAGQEFLGDFDFDGALLGGHIGLDRQLGPLVLGVVGDLEWADGSGTGGAGDPGFGKDARAAANWQGSARARIGAAFGNVMLYGTGGLAVGHYDFDYSCCFQNSPPRFGLGDEFNETLLGYTVGGGVAVGAFSSWVAWTDYRFTEYETATGSADFCCGGTHQHDMTSHAVRFGLSRKFGGGLRSE
jgi:outer membrane immunogenic protein